LPETGQEYLRRKAEILEASRLHQQDEETKVSILHQKAESLQGEQCSMAKRELNKREALRLLSEAEKIVGSDSGYKFQRQLNNLVDEVRSDEAMVIAHGGQIITQSFLETLRLDKAERRVVKFRETLYLVFLEYPAIRDSHQTVRITWQGRYGRTESDRVGKPIGEFGPPTAKRAIASLDQFNNEELLAVEKWERSSQ